MRFWYVQNIDCLEQPPDYELALCGVWNDPGSDKPLIEIKLFCDKLHELVLYTHNPTMMSVEDPTDEDIFRKYHAKICKMSERVRKKRFTELFPSE